MTEFNVGKYIANLAEAYSNNKAYLSKQINKILRIRDTRSQIRLDRITLTALKGNINERVFKKENSSLNNRSWLNWIDCGCGCYGYDKNKSCKLCGKHKDLDL